MGVEIATGKVCGSGGFKNALKGGSYWAVSAYIISKGFGSVDNLSSVKDGNRGSMRKKEKKWRENILGQMEFGVKPIFFR